MPLVPCPAPRSHLDLWVVAPDAVLRDGRDVRVELLRAVDDVVGEEGAVGTHVQRSGPARDGVQRLVAVDLVRDAAEQAIAVAAHGHDCMQAGHDRDGT